jgi:hypothetical protein
MELMTIWLDDSTAASQRHADTADQKISKSTSKKKKSFVGTAKKNSKAGKKSSPEGSKASAKKKVDVKHAKLARDSFTIPEDELQLLADTKKKCLKAGIDIKKSELIRIGISIIHGLGLSRIKKEKRTLQPIKTGRPKKAKLG